MERVKEIISYENKVKEDLNKLLNKVEKLYFSGKSFNESISIVLKENQ